jgi:hypothetical protein
MSEFIRTHRSAVADYMDRLISKRNARRRRHRASANRPVPPLYSVFNHGTRRHRTGRPPL